MVREMAPRGSRDRTGTMRASSLWTGGAIARAYPATSMMTIWKANWKMAKIPPYHAEAMLGKVALGAKTRASATPTKVSSTAKTYGSGIIFSKVNIEHCCGAT